MEEIQEEIQIETSKMLKANNEWNIEGLRAARSDNDSDEVTCPITERALFYVKDNGNKVMLDSFGICYNCQKVLHASHLKFADSTAHSWPVEYEGAWCLDCAKLSPLEWAEPVENWSKVGR